MRSRIFRDFFARGLLSFSMLVSILTPSISHAFEDPTQGKPFLPWIWDDQLKPTIREGFDVDGFAIMLATTAATIGARQYDGKMRENYGDNRRMPAKISGIGSVLGNGGPSIATALGLLFFDQPEGLKMGRAIVLTAASHISIAVAVGRVRPNNGERSFPSGHTSSVFAVAGSLAYSYGPWIGVPALALASFVGASRIADNAHWLSDTVAAAGLGLFWARASAEMELEKGSLTPKNSSQFGHSTRGFTPQLIPGGMILGYQSEF